MGGQEIGTRQLGDVTVDPAALRKSAVHVADRIAARHPDPRDDLMPRLAGRQLAHDPHVRAELLLLLDAIGYRKETP